MALVVRAVGPTINMDGTVVINLATIGPNDRVSGQPTAAPESAALMLSNSQTTVVYFAFLNLVPGAPPTVPVPPSA